MAIQRGIRYPLTLSNGGLAVSEDIDLVKEAIFSVLETRPGERIMRFSYGTYDYIFDTVKDPGVICEQIRISLRTQIPEIDQLEVTGKIDESGVMQVQILWGVNGIPQPPIGYQLAF